MIKRGYITLVILILFATINTLSAQTYIGIKGGLGGGSIRLVPTEETEMNLATPLAGLTYRYYGGDAFFGGIQLELNLQQKSYKTLPRMDSDSSYVREITQIELPFLWQPHFFLFHRKAVVFFNGGPYVAYNISSNERFVSKTNGTIYDREYEFNSEKDNRMEYGLAFGGGFGVNITKNMEIRADFRYDYGFSDLLKNSNKYEDNPYNSPLDFLSVSFGISYKINQ